MLHSERGLFEMILEFGGPDYFDEDRANNWFAGIMLVMFAALGAALAWSHK